MFVWAEDEVELLRHIEEGEHHKQTFDINFSLLLFCYLRRSRTSVKCSCG